MSLIRIMTEIKVVGMMKDPQELWTREEAAH